MDQGKKRSGADVLAIAGNPQAQTLASALRWCWRYEHQQMLSATIPLLDYELPGYLAQHQTIITSVSWGRMLKALLSAGAATMLHMRMHAQDPRLAKAVFEPKPRAQVTATDPVYLVRERYISMGERCITACSGRAATIVRAWNGRRGPAMPQGSGRAQTRRFGDQSNTPTSCSWWRRRCIRHTCLGFALRCRGVPAPTGLLASLQLHP
jgi:hypothetical protein